MLMQGRVWALFATFVARSGLRSQSFQVSLKFNVLYLLRSLSAGLLEEWLELRRGWLIVRTLSVLPTLHAIESWNAFRWSTESTRLTHGKRICIFRLQRGTDLRLVKHWIETRRLILNVFNYFVVVISLAEFHDFVIQSSLLTVLLDIVRSAIVRCGRVERKPEGVLVVYSLRFLLVWNPDQRTAFLLSLVAQWGNQLLGLDRLSFRLPHRSELDVWCWARCHARSHGCSSQIIVSSCSFELRLRLLQTVQGLLVKLLTCFTLLLSWAYSVSFGP